MSQDGLPPDHATRTEGEGETLDMPEGLGMFTRGQVLGERYQILEMLGRGGMGEVWQAFDLKLRVEVALKALRSDLFKSERRLELLRQEVRAAREVMSPNVCRIFDLIEIEGRELVSMEYVDGATLLGVLQERGPLDLKEAQDIASQFLAGLEAIHKTGLVHRDIKPENIMLTRAGRVVVMDFGLARQDTEGGGSVSGTPAYMAPEQAAGQTLDARADVYAAGVVLAEMVSPDGIKSYESRQSVWEGVRSEPAKVPDSPWAPVLKKAVAKDREGRFNTARTLTRALEDVTLRVEGAEDLHPYPGLASFTEEDAEYFFGREAEVEQMWRKLEKPPRMLALAGPSGAGKSSFLRAGLAATKRPGWVHVICSPGSDPLASLRRAVISELEGDSEALRELAVGDHDASVSAVSRWGQHSEHALLVVDQFEELFTQNTLDEQRKFADLLRRLVLEANVFVLLSMRDDFLFHCHQHEALRSVLSDLTMLGPPEGAALRRALVQPAMKCGYRFEDDELVEEMLAEVEGERGALPLLAFALARLWERRDREAGLLTREAYRDIGGVGGALARHAEATIDRIGTDRIAHVREIFRNLVTAEGTRAVREWKELLSVFEGESSSLSSRAKRPLAAESRDPHRVKSASLPSSSLRDSGDPSTRSSDSLAQDDRKNAAAEVLHELINARLLTSYEVREEDNEPTRMVEIIHESLLASWPRLVGWQTRDADSARLRDELRQATRTWDDHQRSRDYLWTGKAFREFAVWRENYTGGLTKLEEEFSKAASAYAKRRVRLRRLVTAAAFVFLFAVLGVVGISRQQAVAEANRAEASKLFTLGRFAFEADRTEALAFAIASLERSDTPEGRRLALRALWAGPSATLLPDLPTSGPLNPNRISPSALGISPDGCFIAAGYNGGVLRIFPRDGGEPVTLQGFDEDRGFVSDLHFSPDGRYLVGGANTSRGEVRVWDTEVWKLERILQSPEPPESLVGPGGWGIAFGQVEPEMLSVLTVTYRYEGGEYEDPGHWLLRRWPLDGGPSEFVGEVAGNQGPIAFPVLPRGLLATGFEKDLYLHRLDALGREPPRVIGRHAERLGLRLAFDPTGGRLAASDQGGTLLVWPLDGDGRRPERKLETAGRWSGMTFSPDGSRLAHGSGTGGWLWNLRGPAFGEPLHLGVEETIMWEVAFTPDGRWLATTSGGLQHYRLALWPMSDRYPRVLRNVAEPVFFHPDGSRVFTTIEDENGAQLLSWPLSGGAGRGPTFHFQGSGIAVDRLGRFVIARDERGVWKVPLDGTDPVLFDGTFLMGRLDLDPTGRYLAGLSKVIQDDSVVGVLDLGTGEIVEFEPPGDGSSDSRYFDPDGRLLIARGGVLSRWDPESQTIEVLINEGIPLANPIDDHRLYVGWEGVGYRSILDLEDGSRRALPQAHQQPSYIVFDGVADIAVSGHPDGELRVGPLFSEEYHLLLGHLEGYAMTEAISPDGKWLASLGADDTAYLWPMPDVTKRPFHLLPYGELMAKLKALTNLRAVPDENSHTGYTIEPDFTAYHGWAEVPEW